MSRAITTMGDASWASRMVKSGSPPTPAETQLFFQRLAQSNSVEIKNPAGPNWKAPEVLLCRFSGAFRRVCAANRSDPVIDLEGSLGMDIGCFITWMYTGTFVNPLASEIMNLMMGVVLEAPEFEYHIMEMIHDKLTKTREGGSHDWTDPHPTFEKDIVALLRCCLGSRDQFQADIKVAPFRFSLDCLAWKVARGCEISTQLFWEEMVRGGKDVSLYLVRQTRVYDLGQSLAAPWARGNWEEYITLFDGHGRLEAA